MQPQAVLPIGQTLITCLTLSWEWGLQSRWEMGAGAAPELTVPVQPRTKLVKAWMVTASPPSHPPGRDLPWPAPILHPPPRPVPWNFLHFLPLKPPCGLPCKAPPHTHTLISNCIRKKLPREFQWRNLLRTWKQRAWKGWRTVGQTESKCYRMLLSGARGARGGLLPSPHVAESPEGRTAGDAPL